jgi:hypothetical protein
VREAKATPNKPAPKPAAAPPPTEDIKSEGPKPDDAKKGEPAKNAECEAAQGATAIAVEIVPTPAPVLPLAEEQKPEGSNPDEVKPEADKKAEQPKNAEKTENADEAKKQVEALQKDTLAALADANATVKQFADLGIPLGWNDDRLKAARVTALLWTCSELPKGATERYGTWQQACKSDEDGYKGPKGQQFENVYLEVPLSPNAWFYLLLGGLLIGLGSPFWYDVVTGLTTLRNAAGGKTATAPPPQPGAGPPAAEAAKAQPVTPVGAFQVSNAAAILATGRAAAAEDRNSAASPRAPGTEDGSDEAE